MNTDLTLIDVYNDQTGWLLADTQKQYGDEGYEIAYYDGEAIQLATAEAKRRNATSVRSGFNVFVTSWTKYDGTSKMSERKEDDAFRYTA